jgi:hypothetical protein
MDIVTNEVIQVVIKTNIVPVTNIVNVTETRIIDVTNAITVPVTKTVIDWVTNVVTTTNTLEVYDYKVNTNAVTTVNAIKETARLIPGVGPFADLLGGILLGGLAVYARLRSTKKTAAVLAQVIEVGREILSQTPQGAQAATAWKDWMIKHQATQGVFESVLKLVSNKTVVDNAEASRIATQLLSLMDETKTK